jgi:hypothetical protein
MGVFEMRKREGSISGWGIIKPGTRDEVSPALVRKKRSAIVLLFIGCGI